MFQFMCYYRCCLIREFLWAVTDRSCCGGISIESDHPAKFMKLFEAFHSGSMSSWIVVTNSAYFCEGLDYAGDIDVKLNSPSHVGLICRLSY